MPASRSAAATTLAPRSCPSRPGFPTSTRILRCMLSPGWNWGGTPDRLTGENPPSARPHQPRGARHPAAASALRVRGAGRPSLQGLRALRVLTEREQPHGLVATALRLLELLGRGDEGAAVLVRDVADHGAS